MGGGWGVERGGDRVSSAEVAGARPVKARRAAGGGRRTTTHPLCIDVLLHQSRDALAHSEAAHKVPTDPLVVHRAAIAHPLGRGLVAQPHHVAAVVEQRRQHDLLARVLAGCRLRGVRRALGGLQAVLRLRDGLADIVAAPLLRE